LPDFSKISPDGLLGAVAGLLAATVSTPSRSAPGSAPADKIIDPAQGADQFTTPNHGMRFVGVVFTIKAISGSPKDEDANNDAAVVGSNGQTYTSDVNSIAGYTDFSNGQINVAQGDSTKGAVTFQVPTGVKVSKVQWSASSGFGSTSQWTVR
jgi:hypothetical protein